MLSIHRSQSSSQFIEVTFQQQQKEEMLMNYNFLLCFQCSWLLPSTNCIFISFFFHVTNIFELCELGLEY